MRAKYLLDTNVISARLAPEPDASLVRRLADRVDTSAIAAPTWHELRYGVARLAAGRRRTALGQFLDDVVVGILPILPYGDLAAAWHARERVRLERKGFTTPHVDGQIAAIAHVNDLVVVTANVRDFARFDVAVEDWSATPN